MDDRPRQISDKKNPAANGTFRSTSGNGMIEGILHAGSDGVKSNPATAVRGYRLPPLFIALADALCAQIRKEAGLHYEIRLRLHIHGISIASGVSTYDWRESLVAENYVRAALFLETRPVRPADFSKRPGFEVAT